MAIIGDQGTVNSGCQMAMVFIRDQSVFIASVGGLSVHLIKANKAGAITSVELVSPVCPLITAAGNQHKQQPRLGVLHALTRTGAAQGTTVRR